MGDSFSGIGMPSNPPSDGQVNNPQFEETPKGELGVKNTVKAISDATQALAIATKLEFNDQEIRDLRRARVTAAFNSEAPYKDDDLRNEGQGWRFNLSMGYMEGVVARALAPYLRFGADVDRLGRFEGDLPEEKMKVIREEFVRIVKEWGMWLNFYTLWVQEVVLHGWATPVFNDEFDPFPSMVQQCNGYVPEESENHPAKLSVFVWRKYYRIHELFGFIQDPDIGKKAGWNVENVREALMSAKPKTPTDSRGINWEAIEKSLRDGSIYCSLLGEKTIKVFHVFAPELGGKVAHWIVWGDSGATQGKIELFRREGQYDAMTDFLVYADAEPGNGHWTGARGIGRRSFNTHAANDRLHCNIFDQAFASALLLLQTQDEAGDTDLGLDVMVPFGRLPTGLTVSKDGFPALSAESFRAVSILQSAGTQRYGDATPDLGASYEGSGEKPTATQFRGEVMLREETTEAGLMRLGEDAGQLGF